MKKVLLTLLTVLVVLGLFAAAGYAGYRFGYMRGAQITAKAGTPGNNQNPQNPQFRPFGNSDRHGMPFRNFGNDFGRGLPRGFGMRGFPMMGFGLFGLFGFLFRIAVFGLILWFIYWLFARSGWRLTRSAPVTQPPAPGSTEKKGNKVTEVKEE